MRHGAHRAAKTPQLTPEQAARARRLREADPRAYTIAVLAKLFEVSAHKIERALRGEAVRERARQSYARYVERAQQAKAAPPPERMEGLRALRNAAADPRDLTGRILGDPLPGRSALDLKQAAPDRRNAGVIPVGPSSVCSASAFSREGRRNDGGAGT